MTGDLSGDEIQVGVRNGIDHDEGRRLPGEGVLSSSERFQAHDRGSFQHRPLVDALHHQPAPLDGPALSRQARSQHDEPAIERIASRQELPLEGAPQSRIDFLEHGGTFAEGCSQRLAALTDNLCRLGVGE